MSELRFKPTLLNGRHQYSAKVFFKLIIIGSSRWIAGPFRAFTASEWASAPVWRQCRAPKVDTSPAIHRCHAYGIVQCRLLYAYATPIIFNWELLLHIDTSWPSSPILYCSAHFSMLPMLYTPHLLCVPHPFHILPLLAATCVPRNLNQPTYFKGFPFSITFIRPPFPYLVHLITLLFPIFTLNFLSHTLPNSLTILHNFSSESAASAISYANNRWFISNLPPFILSSSCPSPLSDHYTVSNN